MSLSPRTLRRVFGVLALCVQFGCQSDLGGCDLEAATSPIYYDEGGYPAYPGQALMDASCGASRFCHAQGIDGVDRLGAPGGLDLDVGVATSPDELERLRRARRVAWNLRHVIQMQVDDGAMPPGGAAGDTALGAAPIYRAHVGTADQVDLPSAASPEAREMLRNWLACGAHVVEATEGTSTGVGDIVPRGAVVSQCPAGESPCADGCVPTETNPDHCGGCNLACGPLQTCAGGACGCANGLEPCGPDCVDLSTSIAHCGACGVSCGDRFCFGGGCVDDCPAATTDCGGACVDLASNVAHCGGCDAPCGAGEMCADGRCTCQPGLTLCGGACVDLASDPAHCGACDTPCMGGGVCGAGSCSCPAGTTSCAGACVDTSNDAQHCGGCGMGCAAGEGCTAGACVGCGPEVSFGAQVQPIFTGTCAASRCHGGARPAASLDLNAGQAHRELVGVAASCGGRTLVVQGDVDESYLWSKLTGVGMCSGNQMPKTGESLSSGELDLVRAWICRGARND